MAMSAPRLCRYAGCKTLVSTRYCDQHAAQGSRWVDSHRQGNSSQRGYGAPWRKLRTAVLQRDGYTCTEHFRQGYIVQATQVDHIKPKSQGGSDAMSNLQSLCASCHETKSKTETQRG